MKILHTADWHIGAYAGPQCDEPYKRMENALKCLEVLVETARTEQPDIILIAGDIFHQSKVWVERGIKEVREAARIINELLVIAPVAVLYGTPNHDGKEQFQALTDLLEEKYHEVFVFNEFAELKTFQTKSGSIQVCGVPGFDKGHFRANYPGISAEEENQIFSQELSKIISGLSASLDSEMPSVLMTHYTVIGSTYDNGQHIFQANEVVLDVATLDGSNFDLVCLGHIHTMQRVYCNKPVFYSGSIDNFNFNDEGINKGFFVHELKDMIFDKTTFYLTPSREFLTYKFNQSEIESMLREGFNFSSNVENKVVRVLYSCDEATEKAIDKKLVEKYLYEAGAYYVSEIRPEKIETSVNREHMHEKLTVIECLIRYLDEKGKNHQESIEILKIAEVIIRKIEASTPTGGATGLFLPLEISVKNYRSYAEEKLGFKDIFFAMVNGSNGVGKSSLFMDALVDCLYEQPREGELTGWIRAGEKSGAITFEFTLGNEIYRVVRTRQRSGKATLSLACNDYKSYEVYNGVKSAEWIDISCQKLVDTQEKILQLLGMDAETFRSCVLIMQDQYGKFMESRPEDRMGVLANLLGLGIYEELEKETKLQLTNINREIKTIQEQIEDIEPETLKLETYMSSKYSAEFTLKEFQNKLLELREKQQELISKENSYEQIKKEINDSVIMKSSKESTKADKNQKLNNLQKNTTDTELFLTEESEINSNYKQLQETKENLAALDGRVALLKDKDSQLKNFQGEFSKLNNEAISLNSELDELQKKLSQYPTMQNKLGTFEGIENILQDFEMKAQRYSDTTKRIQEVNYDLSYNNQKIESAKKQTGMLSNADCVNIDKANCKFLKSAKEALNEIEIFEKDNENINIRIKELEDLLAEIGYNSEDHQQCINRNKEYQELKEKIAGFEGDQQIFLLKTKRLNEVKISIGSIDDSIKTLNEDIEKLKEQCKSYPELIKKQIELNCYEEKWKQIPTAKSYLETIKPQVSDLEADIQTLDLEIERLDKKIAELGTQLSQFTSVADEINSLKNEIADIEIKQGSTQKNIGYLEEKIESCNNKQLQLEGLKEQVKDIATKSANLQILSIAFSQDGIPHQIVRDIVPELESSSNEILSQMTSGRMRLEFNTEKVLKSNKSKEIATLDISINDVDNGELPYLSRSGGQKVRAALAVSFALAMIKANRVGMQLGMLFVDEPPFLDAEGIESYCLALETIHQKYPDIRIVAISHDENMKSRFPQQITVVSTENGSKIKFN